MTTKRIYNPKHGTFNFIFDKNAKKFRTLSKKHLNPWIKKVIAEGWDINDLQLYLQGEIQCIIVFDIKKK